MSLFKYSCSNLVFFGEDVSTSINRVAGFGYDAIELIGEPTKFDGRSIRRQCADAGIGVSSICTIYMGEKRDLSSRSEANRRSAIDYSRSVADFAAETGAPMMVVAPCHVGKMGPESDPAQERAWVIDGIRQIDDHAAKRGVKLCIEAWNRYETHFLNTIPQALDLMREVDRPNVRVMCDVFHMNIEDKDIAGTVRAAGSDMIHIHFADSNRSAPGTGNTDFVPIMQVLKDTGYSGHITFELLPPAGDPFGAMERSGNRDFYDKFTRQSIDVIKGLESRLV